jgi:hypothetical protein
MDLLAISAHINTNPCAISRDGIIVFKGKRRSLRRVIKSRINGFNQIGGCLWNLFNHSFFVSYLLFIIKMQMNVYY